MDNPNITMEEYIRLEEEKAHRNGKVYNWETATYGRIWDDDEVHNLRSIYTEFPAIVFDDTLTSYTALSCELTVSPLNDNEIDFRISFDESDNEHYTIWLFHIEIRGISTLGCWFWILSLPAVMSERSTSRMLMEHKDDQGQSVFTSRSWRRLFEVQGPVVFELIMEFFSKFRFNKVVVNIDVDDTVMSDFEDSMVTYTAVSRPFGGLSDIGSPGIDGPPVMPEDPYAYVVAAFQAPPSPDYVSVLSYVPESDPEEDDDEDPEEDPADGGDNGDDEDESSDDDEDEDVDIEEDEEEEEHPAPADSTAVVLPDVDQAPSAEETESFKTDESAATPPPHLAYQVTARISIRDEPPTPFWSDTEVSRLLAIPTPPPSPLSPRSSPLPQIPSPPLPSILSPLLVSPPLPVSSPPLASPIRSLGYLAAMIRLRAEAPSTSHSLPLPPPIILSHTRSDAPSSGAPPLLPISLPTSSPPLHLLSIDRESSSAPTARPPRGFRVEYGFVATIDREIMRDLERDVGYRTTDTWDEMLVDMLGASATDDTELGRQMTEDRRAHARTARLMEAEARMSREAWGRSMDASDLARVDVMSLRTQVVAHQAVITELQATERRRQAAITEMLAADHRRQAQFIEALKLLKRLQTQMTEYLRMFASGRKSSAMIFGGQFVAYLAEHFGQLAKERL
ncbi:hypothetical protein Tco_0271617 [Tanacetum coccineum]